MHTSSHTHSPASQQIEYTGTLIHPAEARTSLPDHLGKTVPVLCMDVELDNATHNVLHVEQPFAPEQFKQCQAAARGLKEGTRVTVQAPLMGMRLVARNATHVHVITPTQQPEKEAA